MSNQTNVYSANISPYSTHQILLDFLGTNNLILDVGCNDGYLGAMADKSNTFYGLDYLSESVKESQKIYKDAALYDLNELNDLPWNLKFDLIVFADVLEHVVEPEAVLQFFVQNHLNQNGKVIISVPNIANWQVRLKLMMGIFDYTESGIMDKTHLHLYTYKTAHELALTANLKVNKAYGGASFFGPIIRHIPATRKALASSIILDCEK